MAITVCGSCVEFGSSTMCDTSPGFSFGGTIKAESGFCDTRAFQGTVAGYSSGGFGSNPNPSNPLEDHNRIDKFSFVSDASATDVGDLTQARAAVSGQTSPVAGYTSGGCRQPGILSNVIDKFPFATDANATDVGDMTSARIGPSGQSSLENGYATTGSPTASSGIFHNSGGSDNIDKFPFASDSNSTDVGEISLGRNHAAGQSSTTHGYTTGGYRAEADSTIQKFPFASESDSSVDVGEITGYKGRAHVSGQSSDTSGYTSGGRQPTGGTDAIDKFPFATDASATDVGELIYGACFTTGQSSTVSGYVTGGSGTSAGNTIQKFPFASDNSASDVGELTHLRRCAAAGQQV